MPYLDIDEADRLRAENLEAAAKQAEERDRFEVALDRAIDDMIERRKEEKKHE